MPVLTELSSAYKAKPLLFLYVYITVLVYSFTASGICRYLKLSELILRQKSNLN
jgi:hypothetical protein